MQQHINMDIHIPEQKLTVTEGFKGQIQFEILSANSPIMDETNKDAPADTEATDTPTTTVEAPAEESQSSTETVAAPTEPAATTGTVTV